jgi:hypothetical protein
MRRLLAGLALLLLNEGAFAANAQPLAGHTLLLFGESHMVIYDHLISTLPDELVRQGAKVFSYGACGATASYWLTTKSVSCSATRIDDGPVRERPADIARTQPIGTLIDKHHPDLVVLIIGDTMASYGSDVMPKSWIWQEVSALTKEIKAHGTRCAWVGPAWGQEGGRYKKNNARVKEFSDYLSTIVAPCTYIDSLTFSKMGEWGAPDGQHLDAAGYEGWAKGISNAVASPAIWSTKP